MSTTISRGQMPETPETAMMPMEGAGEAEATNGMGTTEPTKKYPKVMHQKRGQKGRRDSSCP